MATQLLLWCLLFHATICTWNDTVDAPLNRLVARTRNRPVARGAASTTQAHVFTAVQVLLCAASLSTFPPSCVPDALLMTVLGFAYPFTKRLTHFQQVLLGFPFALGVPMASRALGLDPWAADQKWVTACLFGAVVVWTVVYDTVYAHQDAADDKSAGGKSLAVFLGEGTKGWLGAFVAVQVALLGLVGWTIGVVCACGTNRSLEVVS